MTVFRVAVVVAYKLHIVKYHDGFYCLDASIRRALDLETRMSTSRSIRWISTASYLRA